MPLTVGNIVLRVDDLELEAAFWAAALGYERRTVEADDFAQVVSPPAVIATTSVASAVVAARSSCPVT